nr:LysM domain-containing protein [Dermabacter hominis]
MAYSGASQALPAPAAAPNAIEKEIASPAPTAARTATAPRSSDTYTVKQGDTLWTIAKRHLTSLNGERPTNGAIVREIERIAALNPEIDDVDLIFPGQIFNL